MEPKAIHDDGKALMATSRDSNRPAASRGQVAQRELLCMHCKQLCIQRSNGQRAEETLNVYFADLVASMQKGCRGCRFFYNVLEGVRTKTTSSTTQRPKKRARKQSPVTLDFRTPVHLKWTHKKLVILSGEHRPCTIFLEACQVPNTILDDYTAEEIENGRAETLSKDPSRRMLVDRSVKQDIHMP